MSEPNKPFIVNDRRKFTAEGEVRPDAPREEERKEAPRAEASKTAPAPPAAEPEPEMPPPPTAEETEQSRAAYAATTDRLDTAFRAANPATGAPPPINMERVVQSIYMNALLQLGAVAPEGRQPRIDLMGARQTIDMLGVIAEKTKGNLTPEEDRFLSSGLFELRMMFLETTQALARQAADKAGEMGVPGAPKPGSGIIT